MRDNPARRVQREYASRRVLCDDFLLESTAKKNSPDAKKNTTIRTTSKFPSFSRMLVINQYHPNISEFSDTKKMAVRDMAVNLGAKIVCFKFGENVTSSQLDLESPCDTEV